MPRADYPCIVINGKSGYVRENDSFIIGRLMRDFETWMDKQDVVGWEQRADFPDHTVRQCIDRITDEKWQHLKAKAKGGEPEPKRPPYQPGLCVAIYDAETPDNNRPVLDAPYIAGVVAMVVQLGVAAIPLGIWGDWAILLITISGIILSQALCLLPQWRREKWASREETRKPKTIVLTKGNGARHAIVIRDRGVGVDLEDLATATVYVSLLTRVVVITLGVLWVVLLVIADSVGYHTWFLLAVGGIGMIQNIFAAGSPRSPAALGIPLKFAGVIGAPKVMEALYKVEDFQPRLGLSMRDIFFPGKLTNDEVGAWNRYERQADEKSKMEKGVRSGNEDEIASGKPDHEK